MKKKVFISKKAQRHSSKGSFAFSKDGGRRYKMMGGGHGQENLDFLKSRKIPINVIFEYDNGVRRGNVSYSQAPKSQIWRPAMLVSPTLD